MTESVNNRVKRTRMAEKIGAYPVQGYLPKDKHDKVRKDVLDFERENGFPPSKFPSAEEIDKKRKEKSAQKNIRRKARRE